MFLADLKLYSEHALGQSSEAGPPGLLDVGYPQTSEDHLGKADVEPLSMWRLTERTFDMAYIVLVFNQLTARGQELQLSRPSPSAAQRVMYDGAVQDALQQLCCVSWVMVDGVDHGEKAPGPWL